MDVEKQVLKLNGIASFNPMQKQALKKKWKQKSLVVSSPTASGKTLLAELASLNSVLEKRKKVVYTCPLRALASEHFSEFKRKYSKELGIRVALSTGDMDSSSSYLQNYDIIFTTYEKCLPYDEFIVYREDANLRVSKIGDFFNHLEAHSNKISLGGKEQLIPKKDFFTLSFSEKSKKIVFSRIKAVIKAKNTEPVLNLKFDSGRMLSLTASHKLFSLENSMLKKVVAQEALGKQFFAIASLENIFGPGLKRLDLFELFLAEGLEKELGVIFSSVDFDELWKALVTLKRKNRRAKELAKYYLKQKLLPMKVAVKLKSIEITAISGRRSDSLHRMPSSFLLSKEFGKLIGYFVSEGSFSGTSKKFGFKHLRFPMIEKRMIDDLLLLCKKLNLPIRYYPKSKELHVISRPLFYLFSDVFKIGKNAAEKILPSNAFFSNKQFVQGLLEGLFAGDGGPSPRAIEYSTKNYKLALQVSLLLMVFNIHSYIYPQKIKGRTCTYWRVCILGGKNIKRFSQKVKRTKPIIEERIQELANAKNARDDLFENPPVKAFLSKWPAVPIASKAIYQACWRGTRTAKPTLKKFAQKYSFKKIEELLYSPVGFLKCKKIKKIGKPKTVYNIQTDEGNFFTANGLLVKNCDSLLRHQTDWLASVGLLVIDEVHFLGGDRGPTIEMAATKLGMVCPELQVLALSATIPNAKEIAEWLNAELVESKYRPVPLKEGVFFNGEAEYSKGEKEKFDFKDPIKAIVDDTVFKKGKQVLIFANTRKGAEGIALKLASFVEKSLGEKEKKSLKKDSSDIASALEQPTEQCKRLSSLVSTGVAFHHAGLLSKQRTMVEDAFRSNKIKLIAATPTLAAGINIPAHTVIISSLFRYTGAGMVRIPVSEFKQQLGRAGRPKYDKEGRGLVVARSETDKEEILEHYVNGSIEPVDSRLGIEPVLRTHLLALIASHYVYDLASMEKFFQKTFYAKQFGDLQELFEKLHSVLEQLGEMGFVEAGEKRIDATVLGRRVSELYLDPQSAFSLINGLKASSKFSSFSFLFLLCNCSEMMPWLSVQNAREPELWEQLQLRKLELPIDLEREMFLDLNLLKKFNTSSMLEQWIDESMEQTIMDDFRTQPGIVHAKLSRADWLCYSTLELARLLKLERHYAPLNKLRKRLKYGVREELVPLTEVRNIGRVRARRLWRNNIRTVAQLKKVDEKDLSRILGEGASKKVRLALGQK